MKQHNTAPSTLAAFANPAFQYQRLTQTQKVAADIIRQTGKGKDATAAEIGERLYIASAIVHARLNDIMKAQENAGYYTIHGKRYRLSYIDLDRISNTVSRTNVRCRTYQMHEIIEH